MFPWWSHRRGDQSLMPACALSPSLPILIYFNLPHAFKPPWQMAELANHRTQQWRAVPGASPTGQTHCCSLSLSFSGQLSQNIFNVWRLKAAKWWLHKTKHWSAVRLSICLSCMKGVQMHCYRDTSEWNVHNTVTITMHYRQGNSGLWITSGLSDFIGFVAVCTRFSFISTVL